MPRTRVDLPYVVEHVSVLDEEGRVDEALDPQLPPDILRELYRTMLLSRAYDDRRLSLQRQGRIGTFAPVKGQEAAQLGSVSALRESDWMVPAFRETAAAFWRGARIEDDLLYCAGHEEGVNLPEDARDLPIAIPVASQIPHAVGLAWARRLQGKDEVVMVYFGEGATSEGDFHEAANLAGVLRAPVVFLCQNNQYAISVPRSRQTRAETIAQKAIAYGMRGIQVDGNDLLAVHLVAREAVERARRGEGPTLIEAITYRLSVHTTADDPTKYRSATEVEAWDARDPIKRTRAYLARRGLLADEEEARWSEEIRARIQDAVERFSERPPPDPLAMFDHIYEEMPPHLRRQRESLAALLERRGSAQETEAEKRREIAGEPSGAAAGAPRKERVGGGPASPKGGG